MLSITLSHVRPLLALLIIVISVPYAQAQLKSEGPYCGNRVSNNKSNGGQLEWVNPQRAKCDEDESRAFTARMGSGNYSQYLHINNFGFSVPKNADIQGIEVVIIRRSDTKDVLKDRSIHLLREGQKSSENMASRELWEDSWTAAFYGGRNVNWGERWTPRQVNHPGFGIVIDVGYAKGEGAAAIDEVLVTIHFSTEGKGPQTVNSQEVPSRFSCRPIGGQN
jgi:hypothetical protein